MSRSSRRSFLRGSLLAGVAAHHAGTARAAAPRAAGHSGYQAWLVARHRQGIDGERLDGLLEGRPPNQWAKFDPELGYVPGDTIVRDGIDGSNTVYRYGPAGERKMVNYVGRSCRINTYGDSFTQCSQVSDGETWQEHLAAHLGEPIRNFGVGGYGVYQAFLRLGRMEETGIAAPCLVFNIYDGDHERNMQPWRGLVINYRGWREDYHNNPWAHLRMNLATGRWDEVPNPCPTPQALRALMSFEHTAALFGDHEILQLWAMKEGVPDVPTDKARRLAEWARLRLDFAGVEARRASAAKLLQAVGRQSTYHVLEKLQQLVAAGKRKLMVLLSYMSSTVERTCVGEPRNPADLDLVRWLREREIPCVDSLPSHMEEFAQFKLTAAAYVARYYNGHYNPRGNQFFAYAVKDAVVKWLDPKPFAYRPRGKIADFQDLEGNEPRPAAAR